MKAHICENPLYEYTYNGRTWRWEALPIGVPYWPVRADGTPFDTLPYAGSEFWGALRAWDKEPEPESFRVGGER